MIHLGMCFPSDRSEFRSCLSKDVMRWADVIVPIGGDGTFLLAAGRASPLFAQSHNKIPIVGFNSDPMRSEGRLMLPKYYSERPSEAVDRIKHVSNRPPSSSIFFFLTNRNRPPSVLLQGQFQWMHRSRIRTTFLSCNGIVPESTDLYRHTISKMEQEKILAEHLSEPLARKYKAKMQRVLPYLALNEVFIGESLSSRVSHLHLMVDDSNVVNKTKSSGLCVSTGTGSTSWHTR